MRTALAFPLFSCEGHQPGPRVPACLHWPPGGEPATLGVDFWGLFWSRPCPRDQGGGRLPRVGGMPSPWQFVLDPLLLLS